MKKDPTSGKVSLNWEEFRKKSFNTIKHLRASNDFADVTLASSDGEQVKAHKFVLAAASPVFQKILIKDKVAHPIIYMRGVALPALEALVEFLYSGEVDMGVEHLESFLNIARELGLEGLLEEQGDETQHKTEEGGVHQVRQKKLVVDEKVVGKTLTPVAKAELLANYVQLEPKNKPAEEVLISYDEVVFPTEEEEISSTIQFTGDQQELDRTIKSMMQRDKSKDSVGLVKHVYVCKICGKEGQQTTIKCHIEVKHMEGINVPCNMCDRTFRNRQNLRQHKRSRHNAFYHD